MGIENSRVIMWLRTKMTWRSTTTFAFAALSETISGLGAVREKKLVQRDTQADIPRRPAIHMSAQDPKMQYGLPDANHEAEHRSVGQHGSLLGYSGAFTNSPRTN